MSERTTNDNSAWDTKVPLKAKSEQILFSQLRRHYAKYTFDTFTVYKYIITEQIESMGR